MLSDWSWTGGFCHREIHLWKSGARAVEFLRGLTCVRRGPLHPFGPEEAREAFGGLLQTFDALARRARGRLPVDAAHSERPFGAVELRVDAADEPFAFEHGQDVVAETPLRRGHERLEAVVEPEQPQRARAVAQHRVEGAEQP